MSRKIRNKDLVESISKVDDRVLSLLSPQFYLDSYTEVQLANQTPEEHFIGSGFPKGLNPCALFDSKWYRDRYNLPAEEHCLAHYLFNGHRLGNEPSPYFNSVFYRSNAKDIPSDISPLEHFRDVGWKRLLDVHPLFDTAWYLDQLSEPLEIGVIPIEHFISLGRNSGHSPSPMFNSDSYYRMNPELIYASYDALGHYSGWGHSEGKLVSEFIDEDWYRNQSPDDPLVGSWGTAGHFARLGCFEGRTIHPDPMAHRLLKYACDRSRRLRDHLQLDGYGETSSNPFNLEKRAQSLILQTSDGPKVSVIIPTFNHFKDVVACLETISLAGDETPFEVIIVDDCSSPHESQGLSSIPGIRYLRHESNQGFAAACTTGVNASSAEFILLLNNDTEVFPGWLDSLASEMDLHEKTGVVGSMIIRPSLFLQEAGCIIWSDGTGAHHGSGDNPCEIKYRFRRQVDYCSGACLLIRRNLWDAIGGFDEDLAPAYYEDTDLCFAVRDHGFDVIYQPNSLVLHREGSSHGSAPLGLKRVQFRNRHKFVKKWESQLSQHSPNEGLLSVVDSLLRQERHFSKHMLIIDHFVLTPDQDSGSVRMSRMIEEFVSMGYRVHFAALQGQHSHKWLSQASHLGVEVVVGVDAIKPLVAGLKDQLDFVILSRPEVFAEMISVMWLLAPAVPVAYDMVDAHGLRLRRKFEMSKLPFDLESAMHIELVEIKSVKAADTVIAVSQADLEHLRNVSENMFKGVVIPNVHFSINKSTKGFEDRKEILFVGGFQHDPNVAAVKELVNVIMPKVVAVLGPIPITIAGSRPTAEVLELASGTVKVRGWVEDLGPLYEQSRLFVAPLRYGAGVKGKIGESLSHGLPTVTTSIGVEGLALENAIDIMIADSADEMAKIICDLYNDEELWLKLSENGAKKIEQLMGRTALRGYLDNLVISLTGD